MESRLRKLLSPRKMKVQQNNAATELDLHSVPYTTAPTQGRLPVLINHALGKSSSVKRNSELPSTLQSFSYRSTVAGRPPEVGNRPQRGNGPVKLQTSRRLSSGELLVTQQDYDRTLEDIREGEYIVAGKERRTSRTSRNSFQPKSPTNPPDLKYVSTAPSSPRQQPTFVNPHWVTGSGVNDLALSERSFSPTPLSQPLMAQQQMSSSSEPRYPYQMSNPAGDGLGLSIPSHQFQPRHMASSTSLLEAHEEQNPTIQALWKAEYSRLVSIYGQAGVDRNIAELNQGGRDLSLPQPPTMRDAPRSSSSLSMVHSLPLPPEPPRRFLGVRSNASTSNLELAYRDDHSDWSSHPRYSAMSSSAASSSFTTRTSMADDTVSRDDLRKIVDDMRMTYLQAIEAQALQPVDALAEAPARKPRSKKHTTSLASSVSVESNVWPVSLKSTTRAKSWQSSTSHLPTPRTSVSSPAVIKSHTKRASSGHSRRISGPPVAGITTLPAIQASPAKSSGTESGKAPAEDVGLKRADSTTLGSMAYKLTILDNRASSTSSQPTLASSPTLCNMSGTASEVSEGGLENHSPSLSVKPSPRKALSVQPTPEKHQLRLSKPALNDTSLPSWQYEAEQLFADADIDLGLDIDDFESLCDGLFKTPAASKVRFNNTFHSFNAGHARDDSDTIDDGTGSPKKKKPLGRPSKPQVHPAGLGLAGVPAMI